MSRDRYTVNEVEERTKVPASTLRQWERRYGFPKPERSGAGYRLYCDGDVHSIELMKRYIAQGVAASRAAALVRHTESEALPGSLAGLQNALLKALLNFEEDKANEIFSQAYSFHSVETVLSKLTAHTMSELGTLWHQGEIPVTTEHFARAYLQGRLQVLLSTTPSTELGPLVLVACAPLEMHELGALMLAVLLRRAGYRVLYLGANTPAKDLRDLARTLHPAGVLLCASLAESVLALTEARGYLAGIAPVLAFGGAAFNRNPDLAQTLFGTFLAPDAGDAVRRFLQLVQQYGALRA